MIVNIEKRLGLAPSVHLFGEKVENREEEEEEEGGEEDDQERQHRTEGQQYRHTLMQNLLRHIN